MPAHIYMRTGRYADAITASQRAIVADRRYLGQGWSSRLVQSIPPKLPPYIGS